MSRASDPLRFVRDFNALLDRVSALEEFVGYSAPPAGSSVPPLVALDGSCYTLDHAGSAVATDTDGTYSFNEGITIPAGVLAIGARVAIDCTFHAFVQAFPWTFSLDFLNGADIHPVADADTLADPTPTAAGMIGCVRFVGTVRGSTGAAELVPDSFCAWAFPGGSTNRWEGISVNSVHSGTLPVFDETLAFEVQPRITVAGATAGDTVELRTLSIRVTSPDEAAPS